LGVFGGNRRRTRDYHQTFAGAMKAGTGLISRLSLLAAPEAGGLTHFQLILKIHPRPGPEGGKAIQPPSGSPRSSSFSFFLGGPRFSGNHAHTKA